MLIPLAFVILLSSSTFDLCMLCSIGKDWVRNAFRERLRPEGGRQRRRSNKLPTKSLHSSQGAAASRADGIAQKGGRPCDSRQFP